MPLNYPFPPETYVELLTPEWLNPPGFFPLSLCLRYGGRGGGPHRVINGLRGAQRIVSHDLARLSIWLKTSVPIFSELFIKCFHSYYPTVKKPSALTSHSIMKGLRDSTVRNTIVHEVNSR